MDSINFGLHLTLDIYNCPEKELADMELCYKALHDLPERLEMHLLTPPFVVSAPPNDKKDPGGFSGFVMIAESHISLHTFTKRGFVSIDCYSCKEFDTEKVVEYFKQIFKSDDVEVNVVKRGTRYPSENIYK